MHTYDIKRKADEVLMQTSKMIPLFVFMGVCSTVINYVGGMFAGSVASILSLVATIILLPFGHGYIVSSFKMVNNCGDQVDVQKDGLVGFRRFKELLPTYFVYQFLYIMITIVVSLIMFVIAMLTMPTQYIGQIQSIIGELMVAFTQNSGAIPAIVAQINLDYWVLMMVIYFVVLIFIACYYFTSFSLTPYILEKYQMTKFDAMKESLRLMKGQRFTLIKLYLSFFGWMMLSAILTMMVAQSFAILPFGIISAALAGALSAFISAYLYDIKMNVSLAVFYEELDYMDKNKGVDNEHD